MEPWIRELAAAGKLIGPDGEIIAGIEGLTFEDIDNKPMMQMVSILERIETLLRDLLPKAAKDARTGIADEFDGFEIDIPVKFSPKGGIPNPGDPDVPQLHSGTHGAYPDWGSGTMVELHGRERIMPEWEEAFASSRGGSQPIQNVIMLDGVPFFRALSMSARNHGLTRV
jgi:hypothetical protein